MKKQPATFVKLRAMPLPGTEREHFAARRELPAAGVFKVLSRETDLDEEFLILAGGMSHYSEKLFEAVR